MQRDGTRAALSFILPLTMAVLVLTAAGMVSIRAIADDEGLKQIRAIAGDEGTKQAIFLLFGLAAALAVQMVNYRRLLALSPLLFALSLIPVLYTVAGRFAGVPLVRPINGAYAWILLGPISIQPAELTKIALVLVLAWTLRGDNSACSIWALTRSLLIAGLAMLFILGQPDLGTVLTLIPPTLVIVYVAGVHKRHLVALLAAGILLAPILWFSGTNVVLLNRLPQFVKQYQRARVEAMYTDDQRVLEDAGYQQQRAMEALGSGGLFGKGMGNVPAGRKVPEAHTDMVLALIGEQFGLLGVSIIMMSYGLLVGVGAAIASEHRDQTGKLLAVGLITLIGAQAALNMSVALRVMPVTGVTLPLVSYGGSSLVATFLALGLLVNVARNQRRLKF